MLQTLLKEPVESDSTVTWEELANLLFVCLVQVGILLALDPPCIRFGAAALAAGAVVGFLKNKVDPTRIREMVTAAHAAITANLAGRRHLPDLDERSVVEPITLLMEPVTLLILVSKLAAIDALLPAGEERAKARRRWFMAAIDEKIERAGSPEFPKAA